MSHVTDLDKSIGETSDKQIEKESIELLLERLIVMVGKSNEKVEQLHRRVLALECINLRQEGITQNSPRITTHI